MAKINNNIIRRNLFYGPFSPLSQGIKLVSKSKKPKFNLFVIRGFNFKICFFNSKIISPGLLYQFTLFFLYKIAC